MMVLFRWSPRFHAGIFGGDSAGLHVAAVYGSLVWRKLSTKALSLCLLHYAASIKILCSCMPHLLCTLLVEGQVFLRVQCESTVAGAGVYKLAEEEAIERLTTHTMELQQRANRLRPSTSPCLDERAAVLECYRGNSKNPLVCSSLVAAMEKCAAISKAEVCQDPS